MKPGSDCCMMSSIMSDTEMNMAGSICFQMHAMAAFNHSADSP